MFETFQWKKNRTMQNVMELSDRLYEVRLESFSEVQNYSSIQNKQILLKLYTFISVHRPYSALAIRIDSQFQKWQEKAVN